MVTARWNGVVIAQSDETEIVEGNHYFPADAINSEYFRGSPKSSTCPWKGQASYYDVVVDGEVNPAAAWYYSTPKPAASNIKGRVAFWKGVEVTAS